MLPEIQQHKKPQFVENHENSYHRTVLNFEMCVEQYHLGNGNFQKTELIAGLSDSYFAGPRLFLMVLGTGPAGYFEDCKVCAKNW